ncbi:MAG: hypothetical protein OIN66_07085 [Candidatus Methanoperedens sp.]|nr:hypothetical protein [Candidatus Methanoperedens sp.]
MRSCSRMKRREVRYCEVPCGVPVSVTTALNTCEPMVALVRCDTLSLSGSKSGIMNTGVITAGMVTNALLCDRGRSCRVLPDVESTPYTFLGH